MKGTGRRCIMSSLSHIDSSPSSSPPPPPLESSAENILKSCEHFFQTSPPPSDLEEIKGKAMDFIGKHQRGNRPIVMVTSGGTTVPMEKNTVRFIDNFSSGARGSRSAEYFLDGGYAVVFLHRSSSLFPFQRHLAQHNPLEWFTTDDEGEGIKFSGSHDLEALFSRVLPAYSRTKKEGTLLPIPFTTLFQYIFYLRELALLLTPLGSKVMVYLAAAVSDFYIPYSQMSNHKISSSGELELNFSHTPKMVLPLVSQWVPNAFTVTFKLETNSDVLIQNAKKALLKYGHQVVVANLLETCRTAVSMVTRRGISLEENTSDDDILSSGGCGQAVTAEWEVLKVQSYREDKSNGTELEYYIVSDLITRHKTQYEDKY